MIIYPFIKKNVPKVHRILQTGQLKNVPWSKDFEVSDYKFAKLKNTFKKFIKFLLFLESYLH